MIKLGKFQLGLFVLIFSALISCKGDKPSTTDAENKVQSLPPDFEAFYEKFHRDTAFQMAHIVFPLEGRPALRDGASEVDESFRWQKKDWVIHKPYSDMGGSFSRSFLSFSDIVTENIEDGTGQFTMVRRFAKMDNDWYLIYYKEMGK